MSEDVLALLNDAPDEALALTLSEVAAETGLDSHAAYEALCTREVICWGPLFKVTPRLLSELTPNTETPASG